MSRKGGPVSFGGKSMFDVLDDSSNDHQEEEEEEQEQVEVLPKIDMSSDTSTLSKSARKRLARQNAKAPTIAAKVANGVKETAQESPKALPNSETVSGAVEDVKRAAAETVTAVKDMAAEGLGAVDEATKPDPEPSSKQRAVPNGHSGSSSTASASGTTSASTITPTGVETQAPAYVASSSKSAIKQEKPSTSAPGPSSSKAGVIPPQSNFAPALPSDIPHSSADQLPSNRKRKAPQDFSPSGPGSASGPTSPSKLGVKFEDGVTPGQGKEGEKTIPVAVVRKNQNVIERTVWTFIMIGGFITLLCLGHPYVILLVMLCQAVVYKEVTALFDLTDHGAKQADPTSDGDEKDTWSSTLNWYFFICTNYFLYGESIIYYFKHIVFVDAYFIPFARNHRFISFMLYVVGFVGFVANLKRQHLRQQFALFCWVHITLFLVVVSSHFIVNNILEGLIWFFLPASVVICNDIFAYICGKMFGRTPLIKLSPKKTLEGFVGAFLCTLVFGLAWGTFFMRFPYMICPARDLGTNILSNVTCKPNPVFVWTNVELTGPLRQIVQTILGRAPPAIPYAPFQLHCLVMATFASLVAPFGGFFASGFKRAFNIKDFGHSIPGHGGMTDRMDCQFMMGMFAYVYFSSLIRVQNVSVGAVMQTIVTGLSQQEQLELLADLKRFLIGQGAKIR